MVIAPRGPETGDTVPSTKTAHWLRFMPAALIVLALVMAYASGVQSSLSFETLSRQREWMQALVAERPLTAASAFFLTYVAVVTLALPAAFVLTVFGGFLFGWLAGGTIVVAAATCGATLLFIAARGVFGDLLKRRAGPFLGRFAEGFRKDAFRYLLVIRLVPVVPFFIANIAPAFFAVPLRAYVGATMIGIIPGSFTYAWLGSGLDAVLQRAAAEGRAPRPSDFITPQLTLALLALAAFATLPLVVKYMRKDRPLP